MKKITLFSLLAAAVLMVAPKPAAASEKGLAILGGVIGGLIIANNLDHHSTQTTIVRTNYRDGYWDESPVEVWIDGRWVVSYDHNNYRVRHYVGGHYESQIRRVWISTTYSRPSYVRSHRGFNRHHRSLHNNRHHRSNRRGGH